jgi:hypothetical protein
MRVKLLRTRLASRKVPCGSSLLLTSVLLAACAHGDRADSRQASASENASASAAIAEAKANRVKGYYLGDSFGGWNLGHYRHEANLTAVTYGSCVGGGEGGCGPPIAISTEAMVVEDLDPQIQSCVRVADQRQVMVFAYSRDGRHPNPGQAEVLTADNVISISADDAMSAIAAVQSIDGSIAPDDPLPPPAAASVAWLKKNCRIAS